MHFIHPLRVVFLFPAAPAGAGPAPHPVSKLFLFARRRPEVYRLGEQTDKLVPHTLAVRGAIAPVANNAEAIIAAGADLLARVVEANHIAEGDAVFCLFTASPDLTAAYPASGARRYGWTSTPLMSAVEVDVPTGLPACVRLLLTYEKLAPAGTSGAELKAQVHHVYLGDAVRLRPDWAKSQAK